MVPNWLETDLKKFSFTFGGKASEKYQEDVVSYFEESYSSIATVSAPTKLMNPFKVSEVASVFISFFVLGLKQHGLTSEAHKLGNELILGNDLATLQNKFSSIFNLFASLQSLLISKLIQESSEMSQPNEKLDLYAKNIFFLNKFSSLNDFTDLCTLMKFDWEFSDEIELNWTRDVFSKSVLVFEDIHATIFQSKNVAMNRNIVLETLINYLSSEKDNGTIVLLLHYISLSIQKIIQQGKDVLYYAGPQLSITLKLLLLKLIDIIVCFYLFVF